MKVVLVYPKPSPSGIRLDLTMKEAMRLRAHLGTLTKHSDSDGTLRQIYEAICSDDVLGSPIG